MTPTQNYWKDRPTVYRVFDANGRLIYVGQSINLPARLGEHRSQKWWWELLTARVRVELHPTVESAKAAEKVAIQEETPVFNCMGYGDWRDQPHWSDSDHELYAAWYAEMHREREEYPRPSQRGRAKRIADRTRRHLSLVSA